MALVFDFFIRYVSFEIKFQPNVVILNKRLNEQSTYNPITKFDQKKCYLLIANCYVICCSLKLSV